LFEKLDKCLLDHAVAAGTKERGPEILDVYRLQGLSEIHFYLKAEHDFKPDEVAALLQFADPLAVAAECWEEREPEKGFPICGLLQEIKAYDRFPLADPASYSQEQTRKEMMVKAVLDQNMDEYHTMLLNMDKEDIISKSTEITAMQEAYEFMKEDFTFQRGDAEILLSMENPLQFIADQWPSNMNELFDMHGQISEAIEDAGKEALRHSIKESAIMSAEKPSVREQLRAAMKEARQHPAPEERAKGGEAR